MNFNIIDEIKKDPHFEDFFDEYNGKYVLYVHIGNFTCIYFNEVGGMIQAYIPMRYDFSTCPEIPKIIEDGLSFLREESKRKNRK